MKGLATDSTSTGYSKESYYDLYGSLTSIATLVDQNTAAKAAHANLKSWMQNDDAYSNWQFTVLQSMMLPR